MTKALLVLTLLFSQVFISCAPQSDSPRPSPNLPKLETTTQPTEKYETDFTKDPINPADSIETEKPIDAEDPTSSPKITEMNSWLLDGCSTFAKDMPPLLKKSEAQSQSCLDLHGQYRISEIYNNSGVSIPESVKHYQKKAFCFDSQVNNGKKFYSWIDPTTPASETYEWQSYANSIRWPELAPGFASIMYTGQLISCGKNDVDLNYYITKSADNKTFSSGYRTRIVKTEDPSTFLFYTCNNFGRWTVRGRLKQSSESGLCPVRKEEKEPSLIPSFEDMARNESGNIINMGIEQAQVYCKKQGKRLPTIEELAFAAQRLGAKAVKNQTLDEALIKGLVYYNPEDTITGKITEFYYSEKNFRNKEVIPVSIWSSSIDPYNKKKNDKYHYVLNTLDGILQRIHPDKDSFSSTVICMP